MAMPAEIVMRHRLPHFQHLFSGGGYAAGYYSYMWSEVLDADAFEAFEETGNAFDPATAKRLRDYVYSAGNLRDPAEAYEAFRGRLPSVDALLKKRGSRVTLDASGHESNFSLRRTSPRRRLRPALGSVEDGRAILAEGGNAIEAMLAMAACIAAVYPHMNHIGGDGFWLIREPSGRVRAMMGAGGPGRKRRHASIAMPGIDEIPARGPLAALTVPGAVAALDAGRSKRRRRRAASCRLTLLLASAIKHAREGYTVTRSQARLTAEKLPEMEKVLGFEKPF